MRKAKAKMNYDYSGLSQVAQDLMNSRNVRAENAAAIAEMREASKRLREREREQKKDVIRELATNFAKRMQNGNEVWAYSKNTLSDPFLSYVSRGGRYNAVSPEHREAIDKFTQAWEQMNLIFAKYAGDNPTTFADHFARGQYGVGLKNLPK